MSQSKTYFMTTLVFSVIDKSCCWRTGRLPHLLHIRLCCGYINIFNLYSEPSHTHSNLNEFRHASFLWPHMCINGHTAKSLTPYLKGKDLHLTIWSDCIFLCLFRNPSGQSHSCGEQHRGTSRLVYTLCTSPLRTTALREQKHIFSYFWAWVLRCGININRGWVSSFEVLQREWVHWGQQNFSIVLKTCVLGMVSLTTSLKLVESRCAQNTA